MALFKLDNIPGLSQSQLFELALKYCSSIVLFKYIRLVIIFEKMQVHNENYKYVILKEILFKINKEHVGQKHYVALICKERKGVFFLLLVFLYVNLFVYKTLIKV